MTEETTVLLIEDDALVRSLVRLMLEGSEFRLVGEALGAEQAFDMLERRRPELLLVDYRLSDGAGTELVRDLRRKGVTTPALLMTANPERGLNEAARDAGAQGTVLKTGRTQELLEALRIVVEGGQSFDSRHPRRPAGRVALSPREREVLKLVAGGSTNREIAAMLDVSGETVKTLLARTFAKLGARRRAEAVSEAHSKGLL